MTPEDQALISLKRKLDQTEAELRGLGYEVDRCVTPPGAQLGNQRFEGAILILVLFGRLWTQSGETVIVLGAGDRLDVPSGVPFTLRAEGETSAYWLQGFKADPRPEPNPSREASDLDAPTG